MDRIFMDEYYEHLRADNIEAFSKERNDEYVGRAEEYNCLLYTSDAADE